MMTSRLARLTSIFSLQLVLVGGVYSEVVEGCYGPPEPCLERTLSCGDGNVIMMTSDSRGGSARFGTKGNNCTRSQGDQCNSTCCMLEGSKNDTQTSWTGSDLLSVYQNCTNQRSCNLTPVYRPNTTFQLVHYSYSCLKENAVHNLLDLTAKSLTNESFIYYSGEDQPKDTSCSCEVNNIQIGDTLEVYYSQLTVENCRKIRIFPQDKILLNCSVGYNSPETVNLNNGSRVQFDDLLFKSHEFVLFKLTVNQGFRNLSCVCSSGDSHVNNASSNEKEYEYTGLMIGLIVAALMIIVGVVLFCYWRKRTEQTEVVTVHTRKRRSTLMDIYNQEANRQSTASTTKQEPSRQSTTSTTNQEPNRQSTTSKTNQGFTADNTDSVKVTTARPTSESHNDDDGLTEVPLRNSNNSRISGGSNNNDDVYLKPQEVQTEMPLRNSTNSRKSVRSSIGVDDELDADDYKVPPAPRKLESESGPATAHGDAAGGDDGDHGSNQDIYVNTNHEKNLDQNPDEDDNYVVPCENPDFYIDMDNPATSRPQSRVTTAVPSDDLYENVEKEPGDDGALDIYEEMDGANH